MNQEKIKQLKFEIEKEKEYIDSLTENLSQRNEQVIAKELELEELMSAGRFKAKLGAAYYCVDYDAEIRDYTYADDSTDNNLYKFGNCFPTEEAAIKRRDFMQFLTDNNLWDKVEDRVRLQVELEAFAREDESDLITHSPSVFIDKIAGETKFTLSAFNKHPMLPSFKSNTSAIRAITKFGTRLNLLFEPLS